MSHLRTRRFATQNMEGDSWLSQVLYQEAQKSFHELKAGQRLASRNQGVGLKGEACHWGSGFQLDLSFASFIWPDSLHENVTVNAEGRSPNKCINDGEAPEWFERCFVVRSSSSATRHETWRVSYTGIVSLRFCSDWTFQNRKR